MISRTKLFDDNVQKIKNYLNTSSEDVNETFFIKFLSKQILTKKYANEFIKYLYQHLTNPERKTFLLSILQSPINVFCSWYKYFLLQAQKSSDPTLSYAAESVYDLYSDSFEQISC